MPTCITPTHVFLQVVPSVPAVIIGQFLHQMSAIENNAQPTVIGRHTPPKASGVENFTFPIYCVLTESKGKRQKRGFVSWKPARSKDGKFSCSLQLKRWSAFAWLPAKIKKSAQGMMSTCTLATCEQIERIGRHQRILWSNAFKARKTTTSRPYDTKRKQVIASLAKGA